MARVRLWLEPTLEWLGFAFLSVPIDSPPVLSTRPCSHARSLSENRLGSKGAAALAEGLKGNTTLQSLE